MSTEKTSFAASSSLEEEEEEIKKEELPPTEEETKCILENVVPYAPARNHLFVCDDAKLESITRSDYMYGNDCWSRIVGKVSNPPKYEIHRKVVKLGDFCKAEVAVFSKTPAKYDVGGFTYTETEIETTHPQRDSSSFDTYLNEVWSVLPAKLKQMVVKGICIYVNTVAKEGQETNVIKLGRTKVLFPVNEEELMEASKGYELNRVIHQLQTAWSKD